MRRMINRAHKKIRRQMKRHFKKNHSFLEALRLYAGMPVSV